MWPRCQWSIPHNYCQWRDQSTCPFLAAANCATPPEKRMGNRQTATKEISIQSRRRCNWLTFCLHLSTVPFYFYLSNLCFILAAHQQLSTTAQQCEPARQREHSAKTQTCMNEWMNAASSSRAKVNAATSHYLYVMCLTRPPGHYTTRTTIWRAAAETRRVFITAAHDRHMMMWWRLTVVVVNLFYFIIWPTTQHLNGLISN